MTKAMMKKITLIIVLLFNAISYAQNNDLSCRVVESNLNIPISFATARIKNSNLGVIADAEGYFRLPYKYKQSKDTLLITAIGYKNTEIPIAQLTNRKINIIPITIQIESLNEIGLIHKKKGKKKKKKLTARQIVQKAIDNITANLSSSHHS